MPTTSTPGVAFNAFDPVQSGFLSALALGETGTSGFAQNEGYGGVDLTGAPVDASGFPEWGGGTGPSGSPTSAAGIFQFQKGTWDSLAQQFGLNFSNPSDQEAGAWYLAQQTYSQQTGGGSLYDALQSGNFGQVQSALSSVWPSVWGSGGAPMGLASDLSSGTGASLPNAPAASGSATDASGASGGSPSTGGTGLVATIENFFVRGGLIVVGVIVAAIALWFLMKDSGAAKHVKALI